MKSIYLFLFSLIICSANANNIFTDTINELSIHSIYVLEDPSNNLSIDQVSKSDAFHQSEKPSLNFGVSTSSFWLKFTLNNQTPTNTLILLIKNSLLEEVEVYSPTSNGFEKQELGNHINYNERSFDDPSHLFNLSIDSRTKKTFYIKVKSSLQLLVPIFILNKPTTNSYIIKNHLFFGLYASVIIVMFLYNLFVYTSVKDRNYLLYIIFILSTGLAQISIFKFDFKYLMPEINWFLRHNVVTYSSLGGAFAVLFSYHFLRMNKYFPKASKLTYISVALFFLSILLSLVGKRHLAFSIMQLDTLITSIFILLISILTTLKNFQLAKFFLLGWTVLLIESLVFVLKDFGIFPFNDFTVHSMQIGTSIEAILLSFALADRINTYKKEKLQAVQEKESILLEQNTVLEKQVNERTEQLQEANFELKRQALNAQIDPHFIFNSLNSIQNFILKSDKINAQKYLAKFAKLMRFQLNSSLQKNTPLQDEIIAIRTYLELEQVRFQDRFQFLIDIAPEIDQEHTSLPTMLIIPFLENAIWHGILPLENDQGLIHLKITQQKKLLEFTIQDNGIGFIASQQNKSLKQRKEHHSAGVGITKERLKLVHKKANTPFSFEMTDLSEVNETGTKIQFSTPIIKTNIYAS